VVNKQDRPIFKNVILQDLTPKVKNVILQDLTPKARTKKGEGRERGEWVFPLDYFPTFDYD